MAKTRRAAKHPFMSVVVISHNGAATLGRTLDAIMDQSYPHSRYEVIVVDDASSDNTGSIAQSYPRVRYVRLDVNAGVSGARNAGLDAAKGKIYVAFDDDCIPMPTWLEELAKGYTADNPAGVGGRFIESKQHKRLVDQYLSANESTVGTRLDDGHAASNHPLRRLLRYVQARSGGNGEAPAGKTGVTELYGANGSFPVEVLRRVGGWSKALSGIEDRDISRRIREAYPKRLFYIMPGAIIKHDNDQTLWQYLCRPYKRGPVNLAFHRQNKLTPPVFPAPFVYFLACLGISMAYLPLLPVIALLLPQLVCFWWGRKALQERRPVMLLFPYIQLADESMVLAGLARGCLLLARGRMARTRWAGGIVHLSAMLLGILGWMAAVQYTTMPWLHTVVSMPFLLLVPGYNAWLLLRPRQSRPGSATRTLGYSTGLSLLILMVSGLLLNEGYTFFGFKNPLTQTPLLITIAGVTAALALGAFLRAPGAYRAVWCGKPSIRSLGAAMPAVLIGLFLPLLAVAGAITLNNGGSGGLATLCLGAIGCLLLVMICRRPQVAPYYSWLLYSISLSIILGTTMRGWNITGHDVMQEYQVFQLTASHAAWHMRYYQDAYMACLSITILPAVLRQLTGIADPYVFKLLFPLFAALITPILYTAARPHVGKRTALLAAIVFLTFPTFLTDLMMLNRQETAFLFFGLSLLVGLDSRLGVRRKSLLSFLFLTGMILSHYSTSYVALAVLLVTVLCAAGWRWLPFLLRRPSSLRFRQLSALYPAPVVIAALVVLIAWGSLVTQTSDNVYRTIRSITATVHKSSAPAPSAAAALPTPDSIATYATVSTARRKLAGGTYYPPSTVAQFPVTEVPGATQPVSTPVAQRGITAAMLGSFYNLVRTAYALLIEGLVILGLLVALAMRLLKRNERLPVQYIFLGFGMLVLIALQVVLPSAINYGLTRLIQESLFVLSVPMILAIFGIFRLVRIPERVGVAAVTGTLLVCYLVLSGVLPTLTGGYKPVLALSNTGLYYEAYYTHEEEIRAGQWLDADTPVGSRVYSDEFMRRKLITYAGIFAQPTLVPGAIPTDSYVILSYGNTAFQRVPVYAGANLLYYLPPTAFLNTTKNQVYSSPHVAIYK